MIQNKQQTDKNKFPLWCTPVPGVECINLLTPLKTTIILHPSPGFLNSTWNSAIRGGGWRKSPKVSPKVDFSSKPGKSPKVDFSNKPGNVKRSVFSSHLQSKVVSILTKTTVLWITLNIDGATISSKSHTHPSHSQTSRQLISSLSLGVPVPHTT